MVPHLNASLLRLAKSKYESRMPEKLFSLLQDNLFLYYSYEEQLDTELSADDRRRISISKAKLSKFTDPFEVFCRRLIELKETIEMKELIEDAKERDSMTELENDLVAAIENCETDMFQQLIRPPLAKDTGVILELRAGVGGEEAALFCKDLTQMYESFADRQSWAFEMMSLSEAEYGGYREVTIAIGGGGEDDELGIFNCLQFETGVHRVQRVPSTDSSGRVHTSTVTVAVLPEIKDIDVDLRPADIRIDYYRSSGPGGQHVNTTDSAVRLTHMPTGIVVAIQDDRSQHRNKDKAMRILRARIFEKEKERQRNQRQQMRQSQIGSGDRSEKIRTYNFSQNRITDHRINLSLFGIDRMLGGELSLDFARELHQAYEKQQLEQLLDNPASLGLQ